MRLAVATLILVFPPLLQGQEEDPRVLERIDEIGAWSSAVGTWEGKYTIEAAPDELMQEVQADGGSDTEVAVRIVLGEEQATVAFLYEPDGEWSTMESGTYVLPDKIAWHILVMTEGGIWLERHFLSFMRIEEEVADFVITRTVHNWYDTGDPNVPNTYYVFGVGQVTRTKGAE